MRRKCIVGWKGGGFCYAVLLLCLAPVALSAQTIHTAALSGDYEAIERALAAGVSPNSYNATGFTPLQSAARGGYLRITRLLLENNAEVDLRSRTSTSDTALLIASLNGQVEIVELLLREGADPNIQNALGNTALHEAATFGNPRTVRLLLHAGADRQITNQQEQTAVNINRASFDNADAEFSSAQEVRGRHGRKTYDPAVANAPSGVGKRTVLELRDYGVDLFIAGMMIYIAQPAILMAILPSLGDDLFLPIFITGGLVGAISFGLWVAGAVYWARGNRILKEGALALTDPREDWYITFDGTYITLKY